MKLRRMREAVEAYERDASESDVARLEFFKALLELQQARADELGVPEGWEPPAAEAADAAYIGFEPLLEKAPVTIDAETFADTCAQVAAHLVENAGLEDDVQAALGAFEWADFVAKLDLGLAGQNPPQFVEDSLQGFDALGVDSSLPASIVMMVVSFALRAHIQVPAERLYGAATDDAKTGPHERPILCPVCGSPAAVSHVEMASGIDGRSREQYCSVCGTVWPFERMRCGVCGTQSTARLHYFHVEGDASHRLQNCDECGQYQRILFEEDLSVPVSLEVEDVVMAKLDAIALDPRFRQG